MLRASGVPVTELRAGMIIGPGSAAYEVIRDLVNHLPLMITPTWVRSRSTPIALDDLLAYLLAVAELDDAAGRTFDVGGPETVTYEQIMRCYGRQAGRRPRLLAVPVLSPKLSSYWLRLVTSVPVGVARALVEGLAHELVADDADIRRLVPRRLLGLERPSVRRARRTCGTASSRAGSKARSPAAISDPSTRSMPSGPARVPRATCRPIAFLPSCAGSAATRAGSLPTRSGGCVERSTGWSAARASAADVGTPRASASATSSIPGVSSASSRTGVSR